jgi:hypothetical protein
MRRLRFWIWRWGKCGHSESEMNEAPLIAEVFPEFAAELEGLLQAEGETVLAKQVLALRIIERCQCGDDFCATMYTIPKPKGAWGRNHRNVLPEAKSGMIILDVVDEQIAEIEILNRDEIRKKLNDIIPLVKRK